jgi:putative peptidoglycan lipid II flippase
MWTLFQSQEFTRQDVEMAGRSLATYSLGLIGFIAIKVLTPGFSARHDFRTPVRYGVCAMAANLLLGLTLASQLAPYGWGHAGLALSTALAAVLNSGLLLWRLLREKIYEPENGWRSYLFRIVLAALSMSILLAHTVDDLPWRNWTTAERISHIILWVTGGAASYFACLWLSGLRPRHLTLQTGT